MTRKLDTRRLFKLANLIVVGFASFYLILGSVELVNYKRFQFQNSKNLKECYELAGNKNRESYPFDYIPPSKKDCQKDYVVVDESSMKKAFALYLKGASILFIFYGGAWLFNYLFPKLTNRKS